MSRIESVRAVRLELALALMEDPPRWKEAAAELRQALDEPGGEPPDWRIHTQLGLLASRTTDDHVEALSEFIAAAYKAPVADAGEPAGLALALLEDREAHHVALRLDTKDVRRLLACAEADGSSSTTVKLAAQVAFMRGDAQTAESLISAASDPQLEADPALRTALGVARALQLIDEGEDAAALDLLTEYELPPDEPSAVSARSLALYGLNRLSEALLSLDGASPTFDIAAARALVWLRRAADATDEERASAIAEAERSAGEAARLEPSLGDGLLLRAQITLESTPDIDGGRRLLAKALKRLEYEPERARLWRIQRRVRNDDVFRYMALEVAAACGRRDELLAVRRENLPFRQTQWLQDAALAELVAGALRDAGRLNDAADFFEGAANYYDSAQEADRALQVRQQLTAIQPTTARSLQLTEHYWLASFRAEARGPEAVTAAVQDGLRTLDELNERSPDQEPSDQTHGAYLRGLLLARAAQSGPSLTWRDCWVALPWLLIAALDDPAHSYRAAHLAWALDRAELNRPALHYAERSLDLTSGDKWSQETAIVMRMNWYGTLDTDTNRLLDEFSEAWREAVRAIDTLFNDDLLRLREQAEHIMFNALWVRRLNAAVVARLEGFTTAEPLWRTVLDECLKQEPPDNIAASDAALVLRDIEAARRYADAAVANGSSARLSSAVIRLVDEGSLKEAVDQVRALMCPAKLRWKAHGLFPVLAAAWADRADVATGLLRLRQATVATLDEVLSKPLPPLTVELDDEGDSSSDSALDWLVRELLRVEDLRLRDPATAAEMLRQLAAQTGRLPVELRPALLAAVHAREQDRSPARREAPLD